MKKLILLFTLTASGMLSAAPANTVCPVGARPIRADITSTYQGKEIAFCCNNCKKKFDAEPAKYAGKIK